MSLVGKTLGQYEIVEEVGSGGMATVYKAYQPSLDRYVAIKVLASQLAKDAALRKRFDTEAQAVARMSHPHILQVYDFGEQDGLVYIVTEYVEGGALRERMGQPLDFGIAARIAHEMALALDHAHREGIYHRDVKPANILLSKDGRSLLADFGIVKMVSGTQLTETGMAIGTAAYMSPEQAKGEELDGRSDLYSLGVVLYEMVTGSAPFRADTPLGVLHQQVFVSPPPPRESNSKIPRRLERVIQKSLEKEPGNRYRTGREMAAALEKAVKLKAPEESLAALPDQAATVAITPPAASTGRRLLRTAGGGAAGVGKGTLRLLRRVGWFALRLAAVILVALVILGIAAGLGGAFALSSFAERIIPSYSGQLQQFQAYDQVVTVRELEIDSGAASVISPYTLDIVQDVAIDFSPPDSVMLSAKAWERPLKLQGRLELESGDLKVYIERLNGVPLYVVGGMVSTGVNRGISELFERASFELEVLDVGETGIELRAKGESPQEVALGPTPTLRPSPTALPTEEPMGVLVVVNETLESGILEIVGQKWPLASGEELELDLLVDSYPYVFTADTPGFQPARGTIPVKKGVIKFVLRLDAEPEAEGQPSVEPAPTLSPASPTALPTPTPTVGPTAAPRVRTSAIPESTPTRAPYCTHRGARITAPGVDVEVRGLVSIVGTADIEGFDYYKMEMGQGTRPKTWVTLGDLHEQPVANDLLFQWDVGTIPRGVYVLRLVVVDKTGNFESCQVRVWVSH